MATIAERVAAGMALLDEKAPGWEQSMYLPTLDLGEPCGCVLGQRFGMFSVGLKAVGFLASDEEYDGEDDWALPADAHGFYLLDYEEAYPDLTAEWVRQISARLATPAPAATDGGERS